MRESFYRGVLLKRRRNTGELLKIDLPQRMQVEGGQSLRGLGFKRERRLLSVELL